MKKMSNPSLVGGDTLIRDAKIADWMQIRNPVWIIKTYYFYTFPPCSGQAGAFRKPPTQSMKAVALPYCPVSLPPPALCRNWYSENILVVLWWRSETIQAVFAFKPETTGTHIQLGNEQKLPYKHQAEIRLICSCLISSPKLNWKSKYLSLNGFFPQLFLQKEGKGERRLGFQTCPWSPLKPFFDMFRSLWCRCPSGVWPAIFTLAMFALGI